MDFFIDGAKVGSETLSTGQVGRDTITNGRTTPVGPFGSGSSYYTFGLSTSAGVSLSVAVISGGSMRCLQNISSANEFNLFGYYRYRTGAEVRVYRGPDCTGNFVAWNFAELTKRRSGITGYVALQVTTPP